MKNETNDLDEQDAAELPDREAMSLVDPAHLVGTMPPLLAPTDTTDASTPDQSVVGKHPTGKLGI